MRNTKLLVAIALLAAPAAVLAQTPETGLTSQLHFGGDSSNVGQIYRFEPSAGYAFSRHFSISAGLPVYVVRPSSETTSTGAKAVNGIGNAYLDLKFETSKSDTYFSSRVRGTAPTGDVDNGFSTGRATVDWTNYVSHSIGAVTPFGSVGFANTVSDTHFFSRPFSSLGFVGHIEGGAELQVHRAVSVAGSGYAILPSGQQKVYSKLIQRGRTGTTNPAGKVRGKARFETESVVVGSDEVSRDHGASVWLGVSPAKGVNLELGFSRSVTYAYNSIFFNIGFDLGRVARRGPLP
jgi:hypothetical protein